MHSKYRRHGKGSYRRPRTVAHCGRASSPCQSTEGVICNEENLPIATPKTDLPYFCPATDERDALLVMPKFREALKDVLRTYQWNITFSVAAVTVKNPPEPDKMIDVVERYMGSAKRQGKDQISFFTAM